MNKIVKEDVLRIILDNPSLRNLKDCTVAITGASGMIGKYIVNTLILLNEEYNANIKILALVRNKYKLDNYIISNKNVSVVIYDVINKLEYDGEVDYFIQAASPASPLIMKEKPLETNFANTVGTANTLMFGIEKKVKKYLFISSREIYGQPSLNQELFYEDGVLGQVNPLIPRNGYAEGKKAAENMCVSAKEEYNLDTKIVRLAHTYGPFMSVNDGRVQADFLKNVINNENIVMKSEGLAVRTYTYVADAVNAIFKVLLDSKDIVYNISNEYDKISIKELAELLVRLYSDRGIKLITKINHDNDKGNSSFTLGILSSKKIREELKWEPIYSIEDGFRRTVNYLESNN
jgi:nucleoside-diphosphate-sugar epimerase